MAELKYEPIPADHYLAHLGRELLGLNVYALESKEDWAYVYDVLADAFAYVRIQRAKLEFSHDRDN